MPVSPGQFPPVPIPPSQFSPLLNCRALDKSVMWIIELISQRILSLFTTLILGVVVATFSLIHKREWTTTPRIISFLINAHSFLLETFLRESYYLKQFLCKVHFFVHKLNQRQIIGSKIELIVDFYTCFIVTYHSLFYYFSSLKRFYVVSYNVIKGATNL